MLSFFLLVLVLSLLSTVSGDDDDDDDDDDEDDDVDDDDDGDRSACHRNSRRNDTLRHACRNAQNIREIVEVYPPKAL